MGTTETYLISLSREPCGNTSPDAKKAVELALPAFNGRADLALEWVSNAGTEKALRQIADGLPTRQQVAEMTGEEIIARDFVEYVLAAGWQASYARLKAAWHRSGIERPSVLAKNAVNNKES